MGGRGRRRGKERKSPSAHANLNVSQRDFCRSLRSLLDLIISVAQPPRVCPRYYPHGVEYRLSIAARRRTLSTRVLVGFTRVAASCGRPLFLHASVSLARF